MPTAGAPFGHLTPKHLVWSGRVFLVIGVCLGVLGAIILGVPLVGVLYLALSGQTLVQYASYMLQAQLVVHLILSAFLLVPAVFLIQQGRKRIRAVAKMVPQGS